MEPTRDPVLAEAVRRIVARLHPRRIVLFGSRAWGPPDADSDYDLLVLVDRADDVRELATQAYLELAGLPASFDVLVRAASWWREWWDTPCSLERRIETQGVTLHDAA